MSTDKLVWEDKYSVGVVEIDDQHKMFFKTLNELMVIIYEDVSIEKFNEVIKFFIEYRTFHFTTEEKYFKEFNYEDSTQHIIEHNNFNKKIDEMVQQNPKYTKEFGFELINFIEDWLVGHILFTDQKYKQCFVEHGLK